MLDITPGLDALEAFAWEQLDDQGWREGVALLIDRVEVFGLKRYETKWTAVGNTLREAVQRVHAYA